VTVFIEPTTAKDTENPKKRSSLALRF
jgi:hypothetical protein